MEEIHPDLTGFALHSTFAVYFSPLERNFHSLHSHCHNHFLYLLLYHSLETLDR